ncbi:MAG: alpha/beta hydrolase [Rhizobacter sp.]
MGEILTMRYLSFSTLARVAAVVLALLTLNGCAWLDAKQRQLALRPTPSKPDVVASAAPSFLARDERFFLTITSASPELDRAPADQTLALWWLPQTDPHAPVLLYLHGTFRNLYQNLPKINALRQAGFAILAVDYRGWGDSSRILPSEASINADAVSAWQELKKRAPDPGRRVIYGHSMGGAVATSLASQLRVGQDYGALILESTFTRMSDVAAEAGFWGRLAASLTTLAFDSLSKIKHVDAPLWMLHGTADRTVPVQLGRRLRDAAPPQVRWIEFTGGSHSRLFSDAPEVYQETMRALMQTLPETSQPVSVKP